MSHIVTAEFQINEKTMPYLREAVREAGGQWSTAQTHTMYDGTLTGEGFMLPGWKYPVVVTENGSLKYDNYRGNWGLQSTLDRVIQKTVAKSVTASAKKLGFKTTSETVDGDGRLIVSLTCY